MRLKRTMIVYQDDAIIVVEKTAGVPAMPKRPGAADVNTLAGWLKRQTPGARLVHRLDNDTSGLMVAARTEEAYLYLRKIWNTPAVTKKYRALVIGHPQARGRITTPIGHHPRKKKKMVIGGPKARPAETVYRVLKRIGKNSLIEVRITTGVRHQIRVHLASLGHPVIGDRLYGRGKEPSDRLQLHLAFLEFPHPLSGKRLCCHSLDKQKANA